MSLAYPSAFPIWGAAGLDFMAGGGGRGGGGSPNKP